MTPESIIHTTTSIGGGFFIGIMLCYFVKKIAKILMFMVGGIVGLLLYLQQQQIISGNVERLQESSAFIFTSVVSSFDKMTQIVDVASLGIPLTGGLSAGFAIGLTKG